MLKIEQTKEKQSMSSRGKTWKENLKRMGRIINKHDSIGLIKMDAPKDEYDSESRSILRRLKNRQSSEEIEKIVFEEFTHSFGEDMVKDKREGVLRKIAHDIAKKINFSE